VSTISTHDILPVVGEGDHTYEVVEGWAKLPDGWTLEQTGVVTDSDDNVYLFMRSEHPVVILDRDGNLLDSWDGGGVLTSAHGMGIDADRNLYLPVFMSHVVYKFSRTGEQLLELGTRDQPTDTDWPGGVPQRPEGELVDQWTGLARPCDIYIDDEDVVYLAELDDFVTLRTLDGAVISRCDNANAPGEREMTGAHALWVDSHGDVYVKVNVDGHRLEKYRRVR